jgi:hypothetical protein
MTEPGHLFYFFDIFLFFLLTIYSYNCIIAKQVAVVTCKKVKKGILAQLGEHLPYKQRVIGSSPIGPIYFQKTAYGEIAQLARAYGSYP